MNKKIALLEIALVVTSILFSYSIPRSNAAETIIVSPTDSIQEAINNATVGDTIFVEKGIYDKENFPIIVNKTLTLVGEDPGETIIDGQKLWPAIVVIRAEQVKFQNFTIQNSSTSAGTYGIGLFNMKNVAISISSCIIKNCFYAIRVTNSTGVNITRNVITQNAFGIYFNVNSSNNLVAMNWISENSNGITIDLGEANYIYNNNFSGNDYHITGFAIAQSFWNSTYPLGGNYWSNYNGTDFQSGSHQNETGSDGIGDEPYTIIMEYAQDSYPLIYPWTQSLTKVFEIPWNDDSCEIWTRSNFTITHFVFNTTEAKIVFNVTGVGVGFCNITIPRILLDVNVTLPPYDWVIRIDDTIITDPIKTTNSTHNSLFFTFESSGKIQIEGNMVIPEFQNMQLYLILLIVTLIVFFVKNRKRAYYPLRH